MNKEEMEKKRNQLWENKIYLFDDEEEHGPWLRRICELLFKSGWDDCAEEYEKKLSFAKEALEDIVHNIYSNEFSPEMIEKRAREALVKIT